MVFDHDYRRIISSSGKITKEHASNETGVARQKTGIGRKVPLTADSVRLKDQHCFVRPWICEFRNSAIVVSHNPMVGDQVALPFLVRNHAGDIPYASEFEEV